MLLCRLYTYMKAFDFRDWLYKEVVRTHTAWGDDIPLDKGNKDILGVPRMVKPGFRKQDKLLITKESKEVERLVDTATSHLGVHWIILYLEPEEGIPETPSASSVGQMKKAAAPYWAQYAKQAETKSKDVLQVLSSEDVIPPPSPENTIVYIKPTSRVHGMTQWQQIHNIGHAVWGQAKKRLTEFTNLLRQTVFDLQQKAYDASGQKPTWAEMVVVLARLLDLKSFQRIFSVGAGDLSNPKVRVNTALNSFMEAMHELIAAYLRNGGRIPLRPRGEKPGVPARNVAMQPVPEVESKFGVRPWVWQALASDGSAWEEAAKSLTAIVESAIRECVYAKAGPIYATKGYITTTP